MRNRFDHLAKEIGQEALGPSGTTVVHDEISPNAQHADLRHEPNPAREAERARLGLLGRLAAILCLIEIYGHAPDAEEFRACLCKHIAFWQQCARKARKRKRPQDGPFIEPFLWLITAGCPTAILTGLKFEPAPGWPKGVYFLSDILRVGIVVASELPRDRSTLLVRIMAAGPLLARAIEELSALPADAHERAVAEEILLSLQHALGKKPSRTPEEQEFIVRMQNTWENAREQGWEQGRKKGWEQGRNEGRELGRNEGRELGRDEGRLSGVRLALRRVLAARKLAPGSADDARIESCTDLATLEQWLDQAMAAQSVAEALRVNGTEIAGRTAPRRRRSKRSS